MLRRTANNSARPARPATTRLPRAAAAALVLAFVAGCSTTSTPSASPGSSESPSAAPPTSTPVPDASGNPTGATDILLRVETSGGMMLEANATAAPTFTLYGDGTVIFRDPNAMPPEPINGIRREVPYQIVRLGQDGIQALIQDALGPGGFAIAAGPYQGLGADIPTTTFTIAADGQTKQVSIAGFLPDLHPQDAVIVAALGQLAERLGAFGSSITGEIGEIGIPGVDGGLSGLIFRSGEELYSFMLRPLLPDETK